jgi:hypothetical protein
MLPTYDWPANVRKAFLRGGYQEVPAGLLSRSETDSGLARVRRRYLAAPERLTMAARMTPDELTEFEAWVSEAINGGADFWIMCHPRKRGMYKFRFLQSPPYSVTARQNSELFDVGLQLEVMPL